MSGVVSVDGTPVPSGFKLAFLSAQDNTVECGTAVTDAEGAFTFTVRAACDIGTVFVAQLSQIGVLSQTEFVVDPEASPITVDFATLPPIEISGVVLVDGTPTPGGIELGFLNARDNEVTCGTATTDSNGRFSFTVSDACEPGTNFVIQLSGIGLVDESQFPVGRDATQISVDFTGLTTEQLLALGIVTQQPAPEAPQSVPLLDEGSLTWILSIVIAASAFVLVVLVWFASQKGNDFRKQTEAMVLIGVIIAVILLGVTGKVGSDGLISVLAAIVGWTAARSLSTGKDPSKGE